MNVRILLTTSGCFIADVDDTAETAEQAIDATWDLLLDGMVIYGHWRGGSGQQLGERFNAAHVVSVGVAP